IVVAQGYEAGGHTGEIASMVLIPEIVDAVGGQVPVLAAGGIGCGRPIAPAPPLRAGGVLVGFPRPAPPGYAPTPPRPPPPAGPPRAAAVRWGICSASPAGLRRTRGTRAWAQRGAPEPLPMPLQNLLVSEAHQRLMNSGQPDVVPMPVGQIVGRMNEVRPVADVVSALLRETEEALDRLGGLR